MSKNKILVNILPYSKLKRKEIQYPINFIINQILNHKWEKLKIQ